MVLDLKNKNVLVLGLGESGISVTKFLREEGANVIVNDAKPKEKFESLIEYFEQEKIKYFFGEHPINILSDNNIELIIISPGIPKTNPLYLEAIKREIPVISEIELAYQFSKVPIVAVTGTKGKSTTTTLIGEIFKNANIESIVAGNIGLPFISVVKKLKKGVFVLEVSSFQLEDIKEFRPYVSLFINIYPDHLDRYSNMEEYIKAKARIFVNQTENDYSILNYDQSEIVNLASYYPVRKLYFSSNSDLEDKYGIYCKPPNKLFYKTPEREGIIKVPKGIWNNILIKNFMAASLVGILFGIEDEIIEKTGEEFKGIPFALEKVGEIEGRVFINDSKATNPISTISAIKSIISPIILIIGGRNKNFAFEELFENIKKSSVKAVVLIGETREVMSNLAKEYGIVYETADSLEKAVRISFDMSQPGDIILLSPACASFDMFENYKERGKMFNKIVEKIKNEKVR